MAVFAPKPRGLAHEETIFRRKNSSPFLPAMTGNEWLMNIVMVYEWDMKMGYKK